MSLSLKTADAPMASVSIPDADAAAPEQRYRANAYGLIAALLRGEPDGALLARVGGFAEAPDAEDDLGVAMALLGLAARSTSENQAAREFFRLFIGIGRGELVPFGSWYQTGFLMERPLGELRDDLAALGFERADDVKEPEDHVAALCEVMALLIEDRTPIEQQAHFFQTHMAPWVGRFFADLESAEGAAFYKAVGRFGSAYVSFEGRYLAMPA